MKVQIIGFRKVSFDDKSGNHIEGNSIFAVYDANNTYVVGSSVLVRDSSKGIKFPFVPSSVCNNIGLGVYDLQFDINGSIFACVKVDK